MRAPPALRFVLATRHDVRLGLHRLRLEGELAEIRAGDLRFSLAEAGGAVRGGGGGVARPAVAVLHERTEGWAAGLRLAALAAASTRIRNGSRPGSPAPNGRWLSTCWPRCSNGRVTRCGGCCCAPPSSTG